MALFVLGKPTGGSYLGTSDTLGYQGITGILTGTTLNPSRQLLNETFSNYSTGVTWLEGEEHGNWRVEPSGNQTNQVIDVSGNKYLQVDSQHVGGGAGTYAALVTSSREYKKWTRIVTEFITTAQHRTPTPNAWEVGWLLWNFTDVNHFYYFIFKSDGWELGKEYWNGTAQAQDFLAFSFTPFAPVGNRMRLIIDQVVSGANVTITVTGQDLTAAGPATVLVSITDDGTRVSGAAYPSGKVGLYTEDSTARYDFVTVDDVASFAVNAKDNAAIGGTVGSITADFNGTATSNYDPGVLAGTVSHPTADFNGTVKQAAILAGTTQVVTADVNGTVKQAAILAGATQGVTADLNGTVKQAATLAGTVSHPTADLNGTVKQNAVLAGTTQGVTADLNGTVKQTAALAGIVSHPTADLNGTVKQTGILAGTTQGITADFNGSAAGGYLNGIVSHPTAAFTETSKSNAALAGSTQGVTADLNGTVKQNAVLAGTISQVTADLNATAKDNAVLAGSVSKVTGKFYPKILDDPSDMMVFFHSTYGFHSYSRTP